MLRPGALADFSLTVEGLPLTLWVEAGRTPDASHFRGLAAWTRRSHRLLDLAVRTAPRETFGRLANRFDPLVIEVDLVESEAWFAQEVASRETLDIMRTNRGFHLKFHEGTSALLRGGDNVGERKIVRLLLDALHDAGRDAVGVDDRNPWAAEHPRRPPEPRGPCHRAHFAPGDAPTASTILPDGLAFFSTLLMGPDLRRPPPRRRAVVDRLTFRAHLIETGSESYRLRVTAATRGGAQTRGS